MRKRNLLALLVSIVMIFSAFATTGCARSLSGGHEDQVVLKVWNFGGGVGTSWVDHNVLGSAASRFNELNKEREFENGKKGVHVEVYSDKNDPLNNVKTSEYSVFFLEQLQYNNLASEGIALAIDDVVTGINVYEEGKTIEQKISEDTRAALTAYDGHYHVIPHYQSYDSITYNKTVFDDYGFYFAKNEDDYKSKDQKEPSYGFIKDETSEKTLGPDGLPNTDDDGLPSSIDELIRLCEYIKDRSKTPFIWFNGFNKTYQQKLTNALWVALEGYDGAMAQFNFNSNGKTSRIITGWDGDTPIVEEKVITEDNAWDIYQQESRYHALRFCEYLFSDKDNFHTAAIGSASHTDVQQYFLQDEVAMLIEGTYWRNEATDAETFAQYPRLEEVETRIMPLPVKGTGSVQSAEEGRKPVVIDTHSSYAFINANTETKHDKYVLQIAKEFLQFCYTDESLRKFTVDSSVTRGLDYDMGSDYDKLSSYAKSVLNIKENGIAINPISDSELFMKNFTQFTMSNTAIWKSSKATEGNPCVVFAHTGKQTTAIEYFQGMAAIRNETWWKELTR